MSLHVTAATAVIANYCSICLIPNESDGFVRSRINLCLPHRLVNFRPLILPLSPRSSLSIPLTVLSPCSRPTPRQSPRCTALILLPSYIRSFVRLRHLSSSDVQLSAVLPPAPDRIFPSDSLQSTGPLPSGRGIRAVPYSNGNPVGR